MRDKIIIMQKCAYITTRRPPVKENKEKKIEKIRQRERERATDFREKPIMLQWLYLCNPPLDHAAFWICCAYHTFVLTDQRDWKKHNQFDRNRHRQVPRKQKGNTPAGQFGCRPISLSSTIGSCSFWDMWCAQMFPSCQTVEIGKSFFGKVLCMLNSSSSSLR